MSRRKAQETDGVLAGQVSGEAPIVDEVDFAPLPASPGLGAPLLQWDPSLIEDVQVDLEVRVGGASVSIAELFALKRESVITLDRGIDESVDVVLNGKVVAQGQLVVVGEQLGVRITAVPSDK